MFMLSTLDSFSLNFFSRKKFPFLKMCNFYFKKIEHFPPAHREKHKNESDLENYT